MGCGAQPETLQRKLLKTSETGQCILEIHLGQGIL